MAKNRLISLNTLLNRGAAASVIAAAEQPAPPAQAATPEPAGTATDESGETFDVVRADEASQAVATSWQAGFKAANDRFAAVMESDAGKANPAAAVFMLTESSASAETIIAKLPAMAPAAAAAPAAPNAGVVLQQATVDLTGGKGAAAATDGADNLDGDPIKLWGEVQGTDLAKGGTTLAH